MTLLCLRLKHFLEIEWYLILVLILIFIIQLVKYLFKSFAQSAGAVKYTDCFSTEG